MPEHNIIRERFLRRQYREGMAFAKESDILALRLASPQDEAPWRYVAGFRCRGLVQFTPRDVEVTDYFEVGIRYPHNCMNRMDSLSCLAFLGPPGAFSPHIRAPFVCIGRLRGGTPLVEICLRLFEVITWQRFSLLETRSLSREACRWGRAHLAELPVDARPLRRRDFSLEVEEVEDVDAMEGGAA